LPSIINPHLVLRPCVMVQLTDRHELSHIGHCTDLHLCTFATA